jgi:hypothetical protein
MDWVVLTTAPDQTIAETWKEMLADEGVEVRVAPGDVTSFLGISSRPCRLLVSAADAERARTLLGEMEIPLD